MSLFLFDIDGTLLRGLGSYVPSLEQAIEKTFSRKIIFDVSSFHGLTDRKILSETLKQNKISYNEKEIDKCLNYFGEFYTASKQSTIVLPNVKETLQALKEKRNILGVVTGNVERMARKKFDLFSLNPYFPFGAFGQETYERGELVKLALERAKKYGWDENKSTSFYIGDTLRDVEAGRQAGLIKIALTTGTTSKEKLRAANPDYLFDNFSELLHLNNL